MNNGKNMKQQQLNRPFTINLSKSARKTTLRIMRKRPCRALSYFTAGMKEFNIGNFWGAADSFAWSTRLDPVKAAYFYYFGLSLMHIPRRSHEAEENLQKAISIDPLKPEYHLELGNLYMKSGLRNKAIEIFAAALEANPLSETIMQAFTAAGGAVVKENEKENEPGNLFKKIFKEKK